MPRKPQGPTVRFTADKDFTPDHRTFAFTEGLEMAVEHVLPIFCVDTIVELLQAFEAYGIPAEISGETPGEG